MWRQATDDVGDDHRTDLLRRACNGGLQPACSVADPHAPEVKSEVKPDQEALMRVVAVLGHLDTLTSRWVGQIDVLSKTRCASGAEKQIIIDWKGGDEKRTAELKQLDDTVTALLPKVGASWAETWSQRRSFADARVRVALDRGSRCEEHVDDADAVGLEFMLDADKKSTTGPAASGSSEPAASGPSSTRACCKQCGTNSQPCGDSCISRSKTCHKAPGCAC